VKNLTRLWVTLSTYAIPPSRKNDTGAGLVEYAAIVILVAAIAVAIYQLGLVENISGSIGTSVSNVLNGPSSP
jgi:Flp pilus assembly pilin Flp